MKGLLSELDKAGIRDAIRLVTDTFMVTPVEYYMGIDSVDRWNEDRDDTLFKKAVVDALVEYESDKEKEGLQGSEDDQMVTLTFNMDYLREQELTKETEDNQEKVLFRTENDYFKLKDDVYEVNDVSYDGPLDKTQVLVIVKGKLYKESIMLKTVEDF